MTFNIGYTTCGRLASFFTSMRILQSSTCRASRLQGLPDVARVSSLYTIHFTIITRLIKGVGAPIIYIDN